MNQVKPARKIWAKIEKNKYTDKGNIVLNAVDQLVNFVKPTLGPKIKHILVDFGYKTELMDDGVSIAGEFELEDEFEDAIVEYVRQVSREADDKAGDGTTSAMVLLQAILAEAMNSGKTYPEIRAELTKGLREAVEALKAASVEVRSEEDLYKVARTSYDNEEAARMIAEIIWKVGAKGAVTITETTGCEIEYERREGFEFGRGFIARGMINDKENQLYVAPNKNFTGPVGVFVSDELISLEEHIIPILSGAEKAGFKNVAIFCPNIIGEALGIVALNQMRGAFNLVAVPLPGQGDKAKDFIQDIKAVTGFTDEKGYGSCDAIRVSAEDTSIIGGHGEQSEIQALIEFNRKKSEETKDDYEKEYYHLRQARLSGGIVMIKVGGISDAELKLRLKKIEDAVNATKCAMEEGVVPGAGVALARIETSSPILNAALGAVLQTVCENAEMGNAPLAGEFAEHEAINVLTGAKGNFIEIGVVDATKVARISLEKAVSIATILCSTAGVITSKRDEN